MKKFPNSRPARGTLHEIQPQLVTVLGTRRLVGMPKFDSSLDFGWTEMMDSI